MEKEKGAECKAPFNKAADKVVNWDEYKKKKLDLEWEQFTWKDHLFQVFVDAPSRVGLWVCRAFGEAKDAVMGKPRPEDAGHAYYNSLQSGYPGDIYVDKKNLEADLAFFQKHGLGKKFQEKSAAIARQAFEESRDFSVLVKTGQFKRFDDFGA